MKESVVRLVEKISTFADKTESVEVMEYVHRFIHTVNSRLSATALFVKPFNLPQFPSTNIMYKYQ